MSVWETNIASAFMFYRHMYMISHFNPRVNGENYIHTVWSFERRLMVFGAFSLSRIADVVTPRKKRLVGQPKQPQDSKQQQQPPSQQMTATQKPQEAARTKRKYRKVEPKAVLEVAKSNWAIKPSATPGVAARAASGTLLQRAAQAQTQAQSLVSSLSSCFVSSQD